MKEINGYYKGFNSSDKRIDYLKYGLFNEYGLDLEKDSISYYNEEKIIKTSCNRNYIGSEKIDRD
ncbi:MAG: hypothetical protein NC483_03590 [Ruminococcus sp.]|nr:hypothetical protein [Ruminococcus sp.]